MLKTIEVKSKQRQTLRAICENIANEVTIDLNYCFNQQIVNQNNRINGQNNELQTQYINDPNDCSLRKSLFEHKRKGSDINADHFYHQMIESIKGRINSVRLQSKELQKSLDFYEKQFQLTEEQIEMCLLSVKRQNWCRVCHNLAVKQYECCLTGSYCSFVHSRTDKTHSTECWKYRNPLLTNESQNNYVLDLFLNSV